MLANTIWRSDIYDVYLFKKIPAKQPSRGQFVPYFLGKSKLENVNLQVKGATRLSNCCMSGPKQNSEYSTAQTENLSLRIPR